MHSYTQYFPCRGTSDELDVLAVLEDGLQAEAARTRLHVNGTPVTNRELAGQVGGMQAWLLTQGLGPGDRVAVMLGNSIVHIALIYALIRAGIVWVPVNTRLKEIGLRYVIEHARPKLLITERTFADMAGAAARNAAPQCQLASIEAIAWPAARLADHPPAVRTPKEPLCIIYTSGTTGAPKGVVFTQRMMRIAVESALLVADAKAGDRLFLWEPLCHIGGAQMLLAPFLADVELHVVDRFSLRQFWAQVNEARATHLHYLGGILDLLMRAPEAEPQPANPIRVAWGAGISAHAWGPIRERFGWRLRECYGMTECSSFATINADDIPGSIGKPLPWITLDLVDSAGRIIEGPGTGEIMLASAVDGAFLPCYLDNPTATEQALRGGRLMTGDAARRDAAGNYFFVGRTSDSIRVRGENVTAWEIERVLSVYPGIQDVAAVGVASEIGEQDILVYVQSVDAQIDFRHLAEWANERLAPFQVPRYYRRVESFERTPSERIRKHLLDRDPAGAWDRHAI